MNEQSGNGETEWATPSGWGQNTPAPPSIAEPVLSGAYGATAMPDAPSAPLASKLPWFAAVTGALVLLMGGGFFALTAFAATGGADTPEEAVEALIAAANDEDFITLAEMLEPSERRTLAEPVITEILPELIRLGVLDDSADAGNVEGFEWEFTDITYRVETMALNDDMVHVYFTGGQAAAEFNSAEFPFGDQFRERFGDDIEDEPRVTEDVEDTGNPMVLVERDGRWYMSAMFTIAENARLEEGERLPGMSEAPPALGSSSPDAAIEAMFAEMVEMDLSGLIGRMDPEELAVLYRYSPIFLEEAQSELNQWRFDMEAEGMSWDIKDLDLEVDTDGDDAIVTMRGFTIEVESNDFDVDFTYSRDRITSRVEAGEWGRGSLDATPSRWVVEGVVDGEAFEVTVDIDTTARTVEVAGSAGDTTFSGSATLDDTGDCSSYSVNASDGTDESGCLEEMLYGASGDFLVGQYISWFDRLGSEFGGIPMAARKTDDVWYVSPTTTAMNYYVKSLKELDEGDFDNMLDYIEFAGATGFATVDSGGGFDDDFGDSFDEEFGGSFEDDFDDFEFPETGELEAFGEMTVGAITDLTTAAGESVVVDGVLSQSSYDIVTIRLEPDDVLSVMVEAEPGSDLDTTLEVFGPNGSIAYNDDAGADIGIGLLDSQIETKIDEAGVYTVEVRSFGGFGSGAYTLTVERT